MVTKTACLSASKRLVRIYDDVYQILAKENSKNFKKRENLGRLEIVCEMVRRLMFQNKRIQLRDATVYSLGGKEDKETHIKWTGYHIPASNKPVRARRYSLVVIVPKNYSSKALDAEYSLTIGHKLYEDSIRIPGTLPKAKKK